MRFDILKFGITDKDRLMTAKAATRFAADGLGAVRLSVFNKEQGSVIGHLMADTVDDCEGMLVLLFKLLDDFGSRFALKLFCLLSNSASQ
jgi:hypothetical protein